MIQETLKQLNLGEKEVSVYLTVLQHGKISPTNVAKITGINRTTVYSVAKELAEKGLIKEDLGGTNRDLLALPPQDLQNLVQREKKQIEQKEKLVSQAIEELRSFTKETKYTIPKITFIQDQDLEDYLYKRSDEWHASIMKHDGILWGFQDHTFAEHYEKWIDWEWTTGGPKNLRLRLVSNKSEIEDKNKSKDYSNRRQIKYWEKSGGFTASVWVHGDYLIMVYTRKRPHYLVEIYDALLAANMREFFKGVWDEIK